MGEKLQQQFIPCTMARAIGEGVFFRPIKSWHSATYAGEKRKHIPGTEDGSGCARGQYPGFYCSIPLTVTHRLYWHERDSARTVSAFLSYPDAMGACGEYFWETYGIGPDVERFFDAEAVAEAQMEQFIREHFAKEQPNG